MKHIWGGGVNQAYSRLSTTHGFVGVCMQVNVDLSCLGRMIYDRQVLGAKPLIQFRHRSAERNHLDHLY